MQAAHHGFRRSIERYPLRGAQAVNSYDTHSRMLHFMQLIPSTVSGVELIPKMSILCLATSSGGLEVCAYKLAN